MNNHRIVIREHGGPEVLAWIEEPMPEPGPGEVRIRVEAIGVSAHDGMTRGAHFPGAVKPPYTPGIDLVGIVDVLGEGVDTFEPGQRVAAADFATSSGAYTEFKCHPADQAVAVPNGVDPVEAVCLVVNYVTAHAMLHLGAKLQAGERLLVHGAAGGVGSAALELGRLAGAELYGTASKRNHDLLAELGATPIDYRNEDVVARIRELTTDGVDVVLDPIGGWSQLRRSYRCLRPRGRLIWFGVAATRDQSLWVIPQSLLMRAFLSLLPGKRAPMPPDADEDWTTRLSSLLGLLADGQLHPVVAERIPLSQARKAHERLAAGGLRGKIVLIPGASEP